ncbi:hypothetical protein PALU110988_03825 [Paenibacillus lupini]|uniref:hypothetical protein n=1 Tax=Paenibacillus lupini TaxID=1450204 RepID=UPI001423F061|nr:hypothetical protein [Paenibacillus lupini]NIK25578.1 hypothetical protein [Paenibacillus lupini]
MKFRKRVRKGLLILALSTTIMGSTAGCGEERISTSETVSAVGNESEVLSPSPMPEEVIETNKSAVEPFIVKLTEEEIKSLEQISARDGEEYLEALKQRDARTLSGLMLHAENEYTLADMMKVLEGFTLYFDNLKKLQLQFESNEQNDEYFIENYIIVGTKEGKARSIPFVVRYTKTQGMEQIQNDDRREPLYDSPLIGEYPYTDLEVKRYVQALKDNDKESLVLHLGMYDGKAETSTNLDKTLQKYKNSIDLNSVKIVPKSYDEQADQFLFNLVDSQQRSHVIRINGGQMRVVDDWSMLAVIDESEYSGLELELVKLINLSTQYLNARDEKAYLSLFIVDSPITQLNAKTISKIEVESINQESKDSATAATTRWMDSDFEGSHKMYSFVKLKGTWKIADID